jgi:hypothetical protein
VLTRGAAELERKEGERGARVGAGLTADRAGPRGKGEKGESWAAWRGEGRGKRAGLRRVLGCPFLFLSYTQTIQTILFEFK